MFIKKSAWNGKLVPETKGIYHQSGVHVPLIGCFSIIEKAIQPINNAQDKIKASIEILRNLLLETDVQKTSFITRFVNKVDVFNDGRVLVIVDLFGHKATALVTEESNNIVRIQPILSRHYIEFMNLE